MTIGERIKCRRNELKMSQDELAKKIGYKSRSSINKIELDIYDLQQSKIKDIADALQTTPSYIMGWGDSKDTHDAIQHFNDVAELDAIKEQVKEAKIGTIQIPVLGEVAAGVPIFAQENYIDYESISEQQAANGNYFGLKIKGDSMSPRISEGDTVIVRQQEDAESGDIVIVLINGDNATCKRLMKYAEGISLISFNPLYEPMTFSNEDILSKPVKIIGKVIENRQRY